MPFMLIWPFLRMLGLRAASSGLELLSSKIFIAAAATVIVLIGVEQFGQHVERSKAAIQSAEAESRALRVANETKSWHAGQIARDDADLATRNATQTKVRNENSDTGRVLFRGDDGWLRAKRRPGS